MKFSIQALGRPLFESGLIIFSVLFALFVNRCAENQRNEEQKEVALAQIVEELRANQKVIEEALQTHRAVMVNLQRAVANEDDSLRTYLSNNPYLDEGFFQLLTNGKPLYSKFPSNTSWEAAKATGVVAEFEYQKVEALTSAFGTQEFFTQETVSYIIQTLYNATYDDREGMIGKLLLQMDELISQEQTTIDRIDEALEVLEGDKL